MEFHFLQFSTASLSEERKIGNHHNAEVSNLSFNSDFSFMEFVASGAKEAITLHTSFGATAINTLRLRSMRSKQPKDNQTLPKQIIF